MRAAAGGGADVIPLCPPDIRCDPAWRAPLPQPPRHGPPGAIIAAARCQPFAWPLVCKHPRRRQPDTAPDGCRVACPDCGEVAIMFREID